MSTTAFTIWIETGTGQRLRLASSAHRLLALLVGEAVWAHYGQIQFPSPELRLIEVQACLSHDCACSPQVIARWSPAGYEKQSQLQAVSANDKATASKPLPGQADTVPLTSPLESAGLSLFFPTAQEWMRWQAWWYAERLGK